MLKYGEVYNLIIKGGEYKGIYLGRRNPKSKFKTTNLILVNKRRPTYSFSLMGFKDYRFDEKNNLILKNPSYIFPFNKEEHSYLEKLLQKIS